MAAIHEAAMSNATVVGMQGLDTNTSAVPGAYREPYALNVIFLLVFTAVILASILGNLVVIKATLGMAFKPFTYSLVTNMAVAELISTLCVPFTITYIELYSWVFGSFLCKLIIPMQVLSMVVVTSSIAVISIRRWQVVTGRSLRFPSKNYLRLIIAGLWGLGLVISFPLFIVSRVQDMGRVTNTSAVYCVQVFPGKNSEEQVRRYEITRIFISFVVPMIIMMVFYGAVAFSLNQAITRQRKARTRIDSLMPSTNSSDSTGTPGQRMAVLTPQTADQNARQEETRNLIQQEKDLIKMFYIIILVFIIFYLPYQVFFVIERFFLLYKWRYAPFARKYLLLLTYFPSALHPVCYGTNNRFYARAFKKLFLCKC